MTDTTPQPLPRPRTQPRSLAEGLRELIKAGCEFELPQEQGTFDDCLVTGVSHDSSRVTSGDVFFALPGANSHGADFLDSALEKGARAVITDQNGATLITKRGAAVVPVVKLSAPREALGPFASWIYGHPSESLQVVGITGTNGKTTTSWFVAAAAKAAGYRSASLGTTGLQFDHLWWDLGRTTPEASDLQAALALLVERGAQVVAMEVSSHALALSRVSGTRFATVGFTGLSQDHLDFHVDMNSYFLTKASLFSDRFSNQGVVVLDEWGKRLIEQTSITCQTVGLVEQSADWHVTQIENRPGGLGFKFTTPDGHLLDGTVASWGDFNCLNAVLAVALASQLGISPTLSAEAIGEVTVPGRMQAIDHPSGVTAIVDYAHTPDAIERAIAAARAARPTARVIAVIGAGGNRDREKRPAMGRAAGWADAIFVTDDNPRFEDPAQIRAALMSGLDTIGAQRPGCVVKEIPNRSDAIKSAVAEATIGDVILVLGKGHEAGQEINGVMYEFDDLTELAKALDDSASPDSSVGVAS